MNAAGVITIKDLLSFGSIGAAVIAGVFFFGELSSRVTTLEKRQDLSDDVAAMKTQLTNLDRQLDRIERKLDRRIQPQP